MYGAGARSSLLHVVWLAQKYKIPSFGHTCNYIAGIYNVVNNTFRPRGKMAECLPVPLFFFFFGCTKIASKIEHYVDTPTINAQLIVCSCLMTLVTHNITFVVPRFGLYASYTTSGLQPSVV